MQISKSYFPALTGLRAIAAYLVYLHHFNPIPITFLGGVLKGVLDEMHIGVTIFFVLSGFLITHRYYNSENFSFKKYFINRVARIYPVYFIITTLTFIFFALQSNDFYLNQVTIYILNITFLRGFFENIKFSLVSQGWSLTVEETFYLLAPISFLLIRKKFAFIFIIPLILILIGFFLVQIGRVNYSGLFDFKYKSDTISYVVELVSSYGFFGSHDFLFNYTFLGRVSEFFIGIALALFINNKWKLSFKITYFGAINILLALLSLYLIKSQGDYNFGIRHPLGMFINTFALPLFGIAPLLYGLIYERTIISKILSTKLFLLLGKSSFVFYLIHMGIISNLIPSLFGIYIFNYVLHFATLILLSIFMYKFIEEPLNKLIRKI